jgi:pimeloyl-ACP methyl ester carboxylesterase
MNTQLTAAITPEFRTIDGVKAVPLANTEFLDERLPNSQLRIIDAGHFVWEEAPAEYGSISRKGAA